MREPTLPVRLPLPGAPFSVAMHHSGWAYITRTHAAAIERLDLATGQFLGSIPVGSVPSSLAFDGPGRRAYVSIQYGDEIAVIDTTAHARIGSVPVQGNPFPVLLAANGRTLYVTTNEDRLYGLCVHTGRTFATLPLPATSHHLALHPSGSRLYVATRAGGSVIEVDTVRHAVLRTFVLGGWPQGLAVSADGGVLYVANERDGINVVHLPTARLVRTLPLRGGACSLALTPDERTLYAGLVHAGEVAVVDCASLTVLATLKLGGRPRGIAFDSRRNVVIIANETGWVDLLPADSSRRYGLGSALRGSPPPVALTPRAPFYHSSLTGL